MGLPVVVNRGAGEQRWIRPNCTLSACPAACPKVRLVRKHDCRRPGWSPDQRVMAAYPQEPAVQGRSGETAVT